MDMTRQREKSEPVRVPEMNFIPDNFGMKKIQDTEIHYSIPKCPIFADTGKEKSL